MKQNSPESRYHSTYIAAAIFITIVMVVLLNFQQTYSFVCGRWTESKDTADQSCIRNYIFDFQTLIAGIAAILAAWFTIKQMRETDRLAERRHNDQMDIHKLPTKLKVERTIMPALRLFEALASGLESTYHRLCSEKTPLKEKLLDYQREVIMVLHTTQALNNQLDAKGWNDITDLFDAKIFGQFEQARMAIATLFQSANIIARCQISETIPRGDAMADKELEIIFYPVNLQSAYQTLNEFSDGLKALAELYGIDTRI
jgi:hypothetical protein